MYYVDCKAKYAPLSPYAPHGPLTPPPGPQQQPKDSSTADQQQARDARPAQPAAEHSSKAKEERDPQTPAESAEQRALGKDPGSEAALTLHPSTVISFPDQAIPSGEITLTNKQQQRANRNTALTKAPTTSARAQPNVLLSHFFLLNLKK